MGTPVITIQDFKRKYGTRTVSLLVERLIEKAPDCELASALGEAMEDLEFALAHLGEERQ